MTSADDLADMLAAQHARFFAANPGGSIIPTCLVVPEAGDEMIIGCPWGDAAERAFIIALLRQVMREARAVRYAVWSEVWFVREPFTGDGAAAKTAAEAYRPGDLSRHPDKVEAVFTLVVEAGGYQATRLQEIHRGATGEVDRLGEADAGYKDLGGALAGLMPERTFN